MTCVALLREPARHSHPRTRVVVHFHSQLWRPVIRLAEILRLKSRKPMRNWVSPDDIRNVLELAGLRVGDESRRILFPKRVPFLSTFLNGFVAQHLALQLPLPDVLDRRPPASAGRGRSSPSRSSAPAGTRRGTSAPRSSGCRRWARAPSSSSSRAARPTARRAEIERQIAAHPDRSISLVLQTGKGKGDAVRVGFAVARNERADDPRRRPHGRARGPAQVLSRARRAAGPSSSTARASSTTSRRARCGSSTSWATSSSRLLFTPDRRPAREGHPLRDEGAPARRLRRDRGRSRLLRRLRPVRRLRPPLRRGQAAR